LNPKFPNRNKKNNKELDLKIPKLDHNRFHEMISYISFKEEK
jgi:hypothetical protein